MKFVNVRKVGLLMYCLCPWCNIHVALDHNDVYAGSLHCRACGKVIMIIKPAEYIGPVPE